MTEHIDIEVLADYAEGLLDSAESARVSRHLAECAGCAEQHAALGDVSAYLSALPPPPMPPDIATRIEAAIADEARARSSQTATADAPSDAPVGGATIVPMRHRSRRWIAPLTAAAAAVVVVGGGFALVKQVAGGGDGSPNNANSKAAPSEALPEAAAPSMTNSGTRYTYGALGPQVNSVVKKAQAGTGAMHPKAGKETPAPTLPSNVAGCVNRISDKATGHPLLVDRGTYQGREVKVLVFRNSSASSRYDVWIVDSGCSAGSDGVVAHTTVPRHR